MDKKLKVYKCKNFPTLGYIEVSSVEIVQKFDMHFEKTS